MTTKFHVAILECDIPVDAVKQQYGSYGDLFENLLRTGQKTLGPAGAEIELKISKWHVVDCEVYPDPSEVDAFLLTGSRHNAFANDSWIVSLTNYVREIIEKHQRAVVGICFGHQIIARALGARVDRNTAGWEVSVDQIALTDAGKELFGKDMLSLHQMHRDIVYELPKDCVNLGYSPRCSIQGFYRPRKLLTVQAHPEFNEFIISRIMELRHEQKIFDDQLFKDGMARAGIPHDGALVGAAICKFLLELENR